MRDKVKGINLKTRFVGFRPTSNTFLGTSLPPLSFLFYLLIIKINIHYIKISIINNNK